MIYNKVKLIDNKLEYFKQPSNILGDATQYAIDDGYKDLIYPTITTTQLLGNPIEYEDYITFEVVEKSLEQITAEKLNEAKILQDEAVREFQLKEAQEKAQTFEDADALDNQSLFPFWEVGLEVKEKEKYQHLNAENEVVLYKVLDGKSHTTQSDWQPKDTPSLWLRVGYEGEILDWVQPTGAHDAYQIGDKVKFGGSTYESVIANNTWSPTAYPAGWKKL